MHTLSDYKLNSYTLSNKLLLILCLNFPLAGSQKSQWIIVIDWSHKQIKLSDSDLGEVVGQVDRVYLE